MDRKRFGQKGMTLIEILIVITIIGIVMTIVGAGVMKKFRQARAQTTSIAIQRVVDAIEAYKLEKNNKAPSDLNALIPDYLDEKNLQDSWGHAFHYVVPGPGGQPFDIISDGADEQEGTGDDIKYSDIK